MTQVLPDPFDQSASLFDLFKPAGSIATPRELYWSDLPLPLSPHATPLDVAVRRLRICQEAWSTRDCGYTMRESERLVGIDFGVPAAWVRRWRKHIDPMPLEDCVPALLDAAPVYNISREERRLAAALYSLRGSSGCGHADWGDDYAALVFCALGVTRSAVTRARRSLLFWQQGGRLWAALSAGDGPDPYGIRKEIEAFAVFLDHGADPLVASQALKGRHGVIASPEQFLRWSSEARAEAS